MSELKINPREVHDVVQIYQNDDYLPRFHDELVMILQIKDDMRLNRRKEKKTLRNSSMN
jgi:hypothetical protein